MDERVAVETILLRKQSKKTVKIELLAAMDWRHLFRYGKRNMSPLPRLDKRWWRQKYRLRVDGRWYCRDGYKYTFLTRLQAFSFAGRN